MIKLYIRDISPLFRGAWAQSLSLLPPERQRAAQKLRRDDDAARCVGAGLLLREALVREGLDPEGQEFRRGEYGKPFLPGGPEFSLSHAGRYVALALSDDPVGVDIEAERCTMEIARHFFAPAEIRGAEAMTGEDRRRYLQRLWVAKEAFIKAIGTGLGTPLNAFCVTLTEDSAALSQSLSPLPLCISEFSLEEYRIAVVGTTREVRLTVLP